ncbi:hypothetical protein F9802_07450 [Bacillus aerolatus]|uniref:Uncharacterized protein n=1 Tax=Bacillus aerolatus TaxID=2653354 RepID=A0A6I1FH48_9BACI|nr:hypothetical protein [Bacillus aerolatus]KAB7707572.1 hypothetical protein F9802_07450 [Bacillus aerolatus]
MMKLRRGKRAVYRGREYEYLERDNRMYELYTRDKFLIPEDFTLNNRGVHSKTVTRDELDDLYYIDQFAKYKGYTFPIWEISDNQLLLGEGSYTRAKEVGFPPSELEWERGLFKKWIPKAEIENMWEERKPL